MHCKYTFCNHKNAGFFTDKVIFLQNGLFYKYHMKKQAIQDLNDYIREQTTQEILKEILFIMSQMNETIKRIEKALNEHTDFVKGGF
ncbi:hypothetical protein B7982_05470 [Fibrobacter sp. UWB2]|nr:hypothetical protein B7982_05470 [Fibrobacter sp. UWB2]